MKKQLVELQMRIYKLENLVNKYRYDALTGLSLRVDYLDDARHFFTSKDDFYLTLVDINGLGKVNREQSYKEGDNLIRTVANELVRIASDNIVYRIGGDEFAILSYNKLKMTEELSKLAVYSIIKRGPQHKSFSQLMDEADSIYRVKKRRITDVKTR